MIFGFSSWKPPPTTVLQPERIAIIIDWFDLLIPPTIERRLKTYKCLTKVAAPYTVCIGVRVVILEIWRGTGLSAALVLEAASHFVCRLGYTDDYAQIASNYNLSPLFSSRHSSTQGTRLRNGRSAGGIREKEKHKNLQQLITTRWKSERDHKVFLIWLG